MTCDPVPEEWDRGNPDVDAPNRARIACAGSRHRGHGRGWYRPPSAGPYHDAVSAQPAEHYEDPLDPQRILWELPDREHANFLAAYREALDGARDPAGVHTGKMTITEPATITIDLATLL
jgi:hypothetical protein